MKKNKKVKYIIIAIFSSLLLIGLIILYIFNQYSYEWKEESGSVIGQYRLLIKDGFGNYTDGYIDITYLNGKKETVKISSDGTIYVKSIISKVENPRR